MRGGSPVATRPEEVFGEDLLTVAARVREGLDAESAASGEALPGRESEATAEAGTGRAAREERAAVLRAGVRGLERLAAGRPDGLDGLAADESFGVQAIVLLEGRPAIPVRDRDFAARPGAWAALEEQRAGIRASVARVGRVEVAGHAELDWLGTGFLVSPFAVMTSRRVAAEFVRADGEGGFTFRPGMGARLDTAEELGAPAADGAFACDVTEVIGIHPDVDLALLRVSPAGGSADLPAPLAVSADAPPDLVGRPVYLIGYPAADGRRDEPAAMRRLFADVYGGKRLQPGRATALLPDGNGGFTMTHDCSTLGGNGGSPVIDLADHRVLGLHVGGRFGSANVAVPLFELAEDPLLERAEVNWV
ncbi:trypsin-like serine peptidase [Streptomyces sp. NPDC059979]|uniref:trypsin-like serine peptidase n=1 Tax=Streptomyces sp. NPDC059979 TaxID=3347021 RepID=UPI0036A6611E